MILFSSHFLIVNYLLDTHACLWWLSGDKRLPKAVRLEIFNNKDDVCVSAASIWEIATKYRIGKLPSAKGIISDIVRFIPLQGFKPLSISVEDSLRAGLLTSNHKDPIDRMLVTQAQNRNLVLVSNEKFFRQFDVRLLW